jgi:hypothetical protein
MLWRYMDVRKFVWLVEWRRLYMPNVEQFADRLEGTTPAGHARWWQDQIAAAATEGDRAVLTRNAAFLEEFSNRLRGHLYVSCWRMNDEVNESMWTEYTTSSEAVAVRTSYALLRNTLPKFVEIGCVRYVDYRTADLPSMNVLERISHKDLRFINERELRAVAIPPLVQELGQAQFEADLFEVEGMPDIRVYAPRIEPFMLINAIAPHPRATEAFINEMTHLCTANGLPTLQAR